MHNEEYYVEIDLAVMRVLVHEGPKLPAATVVDFVLKDLTISPEDVTVSIDRLTTVGVIENVGGQLEVKYA